MGARLVVDGDDVGTGITEIVDIAAGVHNHQMDVEGFAGMFFDMFDNGLTETDIGHENAVHDIHMQPVALALVEHFDVALQIAEIGREQ